MTDSLTSPEALVRAGLEHSLTTRPEAGLSAEQKAAREIQKKMDESGARPALEAMKAREGLDREQMNKFLLDVFGTKSSKGEAKPPTKPDLKARYDETQSAKDEVFKFLVEGYDKLDRGGGDTERAKARVQVEQVIAADNVGKEILDRLNAAQKKEFIEKIIKDSRYSALLRGILDETFKADKLPKTDDDEERAKAQANQKQELFKIKKEIYTKAKDQHDKTLSTLTEFADTKSKSAKGSKLISLEGDLENQEQIKTRGESELQQRIAQAQVLDDYDKQLESGIISDQLRKNIVASKLEDDEFHDRIKAQLGFAKERVSNLPGEIKKAQEKINDFNKLKAEKTEAERVIKELEANMLKAHGDMSQAELEATLAKLDIAGKEELLKRLQSETHANLTQALSKATKVYIEQRINEAETARTTLVDAKKTKETEEKDATKKAAEDKAVDDLQRALENRYYKIAERWTIPGFTRKERVINDVAVDRDYVSLITDGPDKILDKMLSSLPDSVKTPELMKKIKDPQFLKEYRPKVAEQLMAARLRSGKISETDARYIASTSWGEKVIDGALKRNADAQGAIDKLRADGVIQGPVLEWFRKHSLLGWLLLTVLGFAGIATGVTLAKAVVGGVGAVSVPGGALSAVALQPPPSPDMAWVPGLVPKTGVGEILAPVGNQIASAGSNLVDTAARNPVATAVAAAGVAGAAAYATRKIGK